MNDILKNIAFLLLILSFLGLEAQNVSINDTGILPDNSSMMDITSSNRGLLIPRVTEGERNTISNPQHSLVVYQLNQDSGFYYNKGTATLPNWIRLITPEDDTINQLDIVLTSGNDANSQSMFGVRSVGVETTTPNYRLHLNESAGVRTVMQLTESTSGTGSNDGIRIGYDSGEAQLFNSEDEDLIFGTNGLERLKIDSLGYLGINISLPDSLIDISGGARFSALNINSAFTFPVTDGTINQILISDGASVVSWGDKGDTLGNHIASQNIRLNNNYLSSDGDNEGIFINNTGNMGVGLSSNLFATLTVFDASSPIVKSSSGFGFTSIVNSGVIEFSETNTADLLASGVGFRIRYIGNGVLTDKLEFNTANSGTITPFLVLKRNSTFVGIKIGEPITRLHVNHDNTVIDGFTISNSTSTSYWHWNVEATDNLVLYFDGTAVGNFNSTTGAYSSISDRKKKKEISPLEGVLEKTNRVSIKEYHYENQSNFEQKSIGVIAQEIEEEFPALVKENSYGLKSVNYFGLNAIAIGAIQEQQNEIELLEKRVEELKKKIEKRRRNG